MAILAIGNANLGMVSSQMMNLLDFLTLCHRIDLLNCFKLKAYAGEKLNLTQNMESVYHRIENIVGKGENDSYCYFLHVPQCSQKSSSKSHV